MIIRFLLAIGSLLLVGSASAQHCFTDEINNEYKNKFPAIIAEEARLKAEIASKIQLMDLRSVANKGTGVNDTDTAIMNIPVVVHIEHDYGVEYITDDQVYTLIKEMNELYNKQNASLSNVINPFIPYIGNAHIRFHLATKDPSGSPTHGITRRRTYLTQGGDDQAKQDYWPQNQYLNIWFINHIGRGISGGIVAAYSVFPATANSTPYYDGIIANYMFINNSSNNANTVGHEAGHSFFLYHPWNSSGQNVGVACGDDDVDDTPPTKGHFGGCDLYDVTCATNYIKNGIDYPDTTNVQNVMDYADCSTMFTKGQVDRMRAALRSATGNRNNLWTSANLAATGAMNARPSLPPVADFSVNRVLYCAGSGIGGTFFDKSWNDTVTGVNWTFSNGASLPTTTSSSITNTFTQPGWVTVTLAATGLHGTNSITKQPVYVADAAGMNAVGYTEDFTGANATKYPTFDYYNTGRKWQLTTVAGFNDQASLRYINNDTRSGTAAQAVGTPNGDFSDFFTPAFDLSNGAFSSNCYLTFMQAGAYRSAGSQNDVLEISYSKNCGISWVKMDSLTGGALGNNGVIASDFTPTSSSQWAARNLNVPSAARTSATFFRFRYRTGANGSGIGTGNNYYLDRINFAAAPTAVTSLELENTGMEVAPNPTSGDAFILLKGAGNGTAYVTITDITGKSVYHTEAQIAGEISRINIAASNIYAKGLYVVKVVAGAKTYTKKLVVN